MGVSLHEKKLDISLLISKGDVATTADECTTVNFRTIVVVVVELSWPSLNLPRRIGKHI